MPALSSDALATKCIASSVLPAAWLTRKQYFSKVAFTICSRCLFWRNSSCPSWATRMYTMSSAYKSELKARPTPSGSIRSASTPNCGATTGLILDVT
eukprot:6473143-Amphidinium_carterae.3